MSAARLDGRRIVVTGAGRGLGAAIAIEAAAAGARLVLCGRDAAALARTAAAIETRGGSAATCVALDLADPDSVPRAAHAVAAGGPRFDALVNNGAQWLEARDAPYAAAEVAAVVDSAITGTFLLTQALLPLLRHGGSADVLTIGSISALPIPARAASVPFYAAKHGQLGLIDGLRQQLRGTPVRVIGIHPPELDDIGPGDPAWDASPARRKGARLTNRDVVEAVLWALTRPAHVTVASLVLDADLGGLQG